jgi:hypothetical protein
MVITMQRLSRHGASGMKTHTKTCLFCAVGLAGLLGFASALPGSCWQMYHQSHIANNAPIIVRGEIVKIDVAAGQIHEHKKRRLLDLAHIKVEKVYKNVLSDVKLAPLGQIAAFMHSIDKSIPGTETPKGEKLAMSISTDLDYKQGTRGIWFIFLKEDGKFYINCHPQQLCPIAQEEELEKKGVLSGPAGESWSKAAWASQNPSQLGVQVKQSTQKIVPKK